ncbi:MORN repeat-containing protein 1 [Pelobates fuscus]|uniref:MORN repeat-containing protein 1 n=1 Tax=Pelobates fuscus TaxID=191477 RepID=UPI002FE48E6B
MAAPMAQKKASRHYVGEVKTQLRHGYGVYVYANSFFRYEGEWKNGKKHGRGKFLLKDGSYYEGEFVDGEMTGNGLQYWASSGNTYSGEFQNGEIHGYGVMQYKNGGRYEGEFVFGIREGHGLLVDKDGQTYRGGFHKNKKNGEGQMSFKNGDTFEGDWLLDKRQGHGVLHCTDGTIYEGQWRNDVFNGQGCMIHSSGVIYDGSWINGHPDAVAKKMVILGEDIMEFVQGSPVEFHVQLQSEEGEIPKNENGRVLKISAGIKYVQPTKKQTTSSSDVIEEFEGKTFQTPFGYECINYPLSSSTSVNKEQKDNPSFKIISASEASSMLLQSVNSDQGTDGLHGPDDHHYEEKPTISLTDSDEPLPPPNIRTDMGSAAFKEIMFGSPTDNILPFLTQSEADKNRGKKLSGKISAEKTEKMTVSQEKIEDSRSDPMVKERKFKKDQHLMDNNVVRPGEYVIMVEDVTKPPFLGQTLPPAFKLVRIVPEKPKAKTNRKETLRVPST